MQFIRLIHNIHVESFNSQTFSLIGFFRQIWNQAAIKPALSTSQKTYIYIYMYIAMTKFLKGRPHSILVFVNASIKVLICEDLSNQTKRS